MTFLVVEESDTVRRHICYVLLSLGIKGLEAASRAEAEEKLAGRTELTGAVIDIDNKNLDGLGLIAAARQDPRLKELKIIAHTVRADERVVANLADLGVAGILQKPFEEAEAYLRLQNILAHNEAAAGNQRRHVRITPPADELLRLSFRVSGHPSLVSGKIRNLSMGGAGVELVTPAADVLKPGVVLDRLRFTLPGRELYPAGVIAAAQGRVVGIRFTALKPEDSISLARYIYETIAGEESPA